MEALGERTGARYERGALAYAGHVALEGRVYRWAREHSVADLADDDWNRLAPVLACLGSPVRLALLRALLEGPRDRQALQATLGEATSGQLYHHLRDLQAAHLVVQRARGSYELPPSAVVPVFTVLAAAQDLAVTHEARTAVEP